MSTKENPILAKIRMPGKRFRLPSRGAFYTDGELAEHVKDGEVEVFSMTAVDEIALRSPEFLFTGEAIERVIKRCVPEVNKPLKLLSKDVDFLLACLRVVSYGGTYEIKNRCESCEEKQQEKNSKQYDEYVEEITEKAEQQKVDLTLALNDDRVKARIKTILSRRSTQQVHVIDIGGIVNNKTIEIDEEEFKKYNITLSNGQDVYLTPYRMDSAVATLQFQNADKTLVLNDMEEFISFVFASQILRVEDTTDPDMISEWVTQLPRSLKEEIDDKLSKMVDWGTDFNYTVKCTNEGCDSETNIKTQLNPITFFMTPSE
jgi:hypothetical protein